MKGPPVTWWPFAPWHRSDRGGLHVLVYAFRLPCQGSSFRPVAQRGHMMASSPSAAKWQVGHVKPQHCSYTKAGDPSRERSRPRPVPDVLPIICRSTDRQLGSPVGANRGKVIDFQIQRRTYRGLQGTAGTGWPVFLNRVSRVRVPPGAPEPVPPGYFFSHMNSQMGSPLGIALVMYHLYCGLMTSAIPSHMGWKTLQTSMG